jgi:archaellum component FlaC
MLRWHAFEILLFITVELIRVSSVFGSDPAYKKYDKPIFVHDLFQMRLIEVLPIDAVDYVDKYRDCQHWRGEDAYDEQRSKDIDRGIKESCDGLEKKRQMIESKYTQGSKEAHTINSIIKEIDEGESLPSFMWNDPKRKSKVLNEYFEATSQNIIRTLQSLIPRYKAAVTKVQKFRASDTKDINKEDRLEKEINSVKYLLHVQEKYVTEVLGNIDRLHPITRDQIVSAEKELRTVLKLKY